ncbi:MAG: DUF2508 domain-containing protein [Sporanaerobacter sp.]|jgi:hypothetical protein|uniref:DUF2508 family protein n=1 Tax=Sporanaerobacter sp. TaxID=2010183 RepID=UPI003A103A33
MNKIDYRERARKIIELSEAFSQKLMGKVKVQKSSNLSCEEEELLDSLRNAFNEWKSKEIYFQFVSEPDLVDLAIYEIEASKIKYTYFLKKAREKGLSLK